MKHFKHKIQSLEILNGQKRFSQSSFGTGLSK